MLHGIVIFIERVERPVEPESDIGIVVIHLDTEIGYVVQTLVGGQIGGNGIRPVFRIAYPFIPASAPDPDIVGNRGYGEKELYTAGRPGILIVEGAVEMYIITQVQTHCGTVIVSQGLIVVLDNT